MIPGDGILGDDVLGEMPPEGFIDVYTDFINRTYSSDIWFLDIEHRSAIEEPNTNSELSIIGDHILGEMDDGEFSLDPPDRSLFSSKIWVARHDETQRPNEYSFCRLFDPMSAKISSSFLPEDRNRAVTYNATARLRNRNKELDWLVSNRTIEGQRAVIRHGVHKGYWSDTAARFVGQGISARAFNDHIQVDMQALPAPTEKTLHFSYFDGTGGFGGDPDLAGIPKDVLLGSARNVSPRESNRGISSYSIAGHRLLAVDDVLVGMESMIYLGDYPDYFSYSTADVPVGTYITSLAHGEFRLNGPATKRVTANVRGYVTPDGTYLQYMGQWFDWMMTQRASFSITQIQGQSLKFPKWPCGFYTNRRIYSVNELLNEMCVSFMGLHGPDRFAGYTIRRLVNSEKFAASELIRVPGKAVVEEALPTFVRSEQPILYNKNYTPMSESDIFESVTDDIRARAISPGDVHTEPNPRSVFYPESRPGGMIETLFTTNLVAEIAKEAIALFGQERDIYQITAPRSHIVDIGDSIIADVDRYGIGSNTFMTVAVEENSSNDETIIKLLGSSLEARRVHHYDSEVI